MFTVFRAYSDFGNYSDTTDSMIGALNACAIYLEDPDCIGIKIWNTKNGEIYLDYWRERNV